MILRAFLSVFYLLISADLNTAQPQQVPTVVINGERYVPLQKWALAQGFTASLQTSNRVVSITNRWAKLVFNLNSKRSSINGNTVWLSSAVLAVGNTALISSRDVSKTLNPILFPNKLPAGKRVRTVLIAAGHGGKDPGHQSNERQEKKYALLQAKVLKDTLENAGFTVFMTRDKDVFVDLEEQAAMATRVGADVFVTIHYNAALELEGKGVETYCLTPVGAISTNGGEPSVKSPGHAHDSLNALLAYKVHKAILLGTDFEDRGLRRASFIVLRQITMPGILIEGGFLSNPFDAEKILSPTYRRKTAQAITDGIMAYKRQVEQR